MAFSDYASQAVLLDAFPTNGGPPPAGWTTGFRGGSNGMDVTGNQARRNAAGFGNAYQALAAGPDCLAYYTLAVLADASLGLRLKDYGSGTLDAYWLFYDNTAKTLEVGEDTNGSYARVGSTVSYTPAAGCKLGLMVIGTSITVASWDGSAWTDRVTQTDATISVAGGIGIEMSGTTGRIDDVYLATSLVTASAPRSRHRRTMRGVGR